MRIKHVHLENFKRFVTLDIPIQNSLTEDIASQFLLLGDNGSGKTSVLQAIALCLSMVSRKTRNVVEFDWLGWVPGRYSRWGKPFIEIEVHFTDDEIDATQEAARRWYESLNGHAKDEFRAPASSKVVYIRLDGGYYTTKSGLQAEQFQFQGRNYAASLLRTDQSARDLFDRLPGVFWFDQFRNLASQPEENTTEEVKSTGRISYSVGVERLRKHLNAWQINRLMKGTPKKDFLKELEDAYRRVFQGRSFGSPEPMYSGGNPSPEDMYFILNDGNRSYDIQEMSAGEQSVFPILYEFIRQSIRNSVVLIDEIDLNLHPPLAQALLTTLPSLGPDCQFILTTHSEAITDIFNPNQVHRLPGGKLCL